MAADRPPRGRRLPIGLMVIGSEMAGFTVVGVVFDLVLGTLPWFTIGLTVFGFVAVFYHLTRMAKAMGQPPASRPPDAGGPR